MIATLAERRAARTVRTAEPITPEPIPKPERKPRPPRLKSLAEKYRPNCLRDILGQSAAVEQLTNFVADPYPCAFILAGDTGTGKTSAAWALAADLGCDIDANPPEFGGVSSIPSGEHTPAALDALWPLMWMYPFSSRNGWRVLIVNEVERLSSKLELLWLDRLEELPSKLVIVFTTNDLTSLPDRFVDRCIGGVIEFVSDAGKLDADARKLVQSIWEKETGDSCPDGVLESVVGRAARNGKLSFRRVVQALVPLIAAG